MGDLSKECRFPQTILANIKFLHGSIKRINELVCPLFGVRHDANKLVERDHFGEPDNHVHTAMTAATIGVIQTTNLRPHLAPDTRMTNSLVFSAMVRVKAVLSSKALSNFLCSSKCACNVFSNPSIRS